ncbi:MAG: M14 family metallopeptidase [Candidatus Aminicenantes bacterium]|nr:M14 family metallopeptidase [Candidatus Aminicenantes bacterium]
MVNHSFPQEKERQKNEVSSRTVLDKYKRFGRERGFDPLRWRNLRMPVSTSREKGKPSHTSSSSTEGQKTSNLHTAPDRQEGLYRIVTIDSGREGIRELILREGLDVLGEIDGKLYILIETSRLPLLKGKEYSVVKEIRTGRLLDDPHIVLSDKGPNGRFHTYLELRNDLFRLQETHPQIARVHDIGDTIEGRDILAIKISDNVELDEMEAEVLLVGCHHAREWLTVEVPYYIAQYLVEQYDVDPEIKRMVDNSEVWIVPLLNPDGLEYSIHTFRWWRKNRRDNGDGSFGVDLNRNYSYMWGFDDEGSSPYGWSQVYRGRSPLSEPETDALRMLFIQREFQAAISYHTYSELILYPWGYTPEPTFDQGLMHYLASTMSDLMKGVNNRYYQPRQSSVGLYTTNGSFIDFAYGNYNIPAFCIEMRPENVVLGGFIISEEEILDAFWENLPAALFLTDWAIQNYQTAVLKQELTESEPPSDPIEEDEDSRLITADLNGDGNEEVVSASQDSKGLLITMRDLEGKELRKPFYIIGGKGENLRRISLALNSLPGDDTSQLIISARSEEKDFIYKIEFDRLFRIINREKMKLSSPDPSLKHPH